MAAVGIEQSRTEQNTRSKQSRVFVLNKPNLPTARTSQNIPIKTTNQKVTGSKSCRARPENPATHC